MSQPAVQRRDARLGEAHVAALDLAGAGHAQVVAEDRALELQLLAQDLVQPAWREARRQRSTLRRSRAPA
jgi:hypothetical protein